MTVKEAARRRDFTINAMAVDLNTGQVLDPFGGLSDAQRGILRATDPRLFLQDPIRGLRGMQLLARKARKVDPATKQLIRQLAPLYSMVAKERVQEEFNKLLLKARKPSIGLHLLRQTGGLEWFPELAAQINAPQRPDYHAEGDVWTHMLLTVNQAARIRHCLPEEDRLAFMYAAMLHDIGKPLSTRLERAPPELYLTAYGHDKEGRVPAEAFMRRLTNDKNLITKVVGMVGLHMQPHHLARGDAKQAAYIRLAKKAEAEGIRLDMLGYLALADKAGSVGLGYVKIDPETCRPVKDATKEQIFTYAERFAKEENLLQPVVMGRDLRDAGLIPGREFTPALKAAFEAQTDHPRWRKKRLLALAVKEAKRLGAKSQTKKNPRSRWNSNDKQQVGVGAWVAGIKLDPRGRYHFSRTPIPAYYGTTRQEPDVKPKGLWYSCGDAWLDFAHMSMPSRLDDMNFVYRVFPGPHTLYIRTAKELDGFTSSFGVAPEWMPDWMPDSDTVFVDWPRVAQLYSGIEICPYIWSRRMDTKWYYPWDVASGCLWGPDGHNVELIARRGS